MAVQQDFGQEEIIRAFALVGETLGRLALAQLGVEPITIETIPQSDAGLLTRKEAAKYLRVSLTKLSEEVGAKWIKRIKVGRSVRFMPSELDRWAKRNNG